MTGSDTHIETLIVPRRRLGRRPRDESRPLLKLGEYLTGQVPAYPDTVDYFGSVPRWRLGANNLFGTCGPTSLANYLLLASTWLDTAPIVLSDEDIFDLYQRSGNPGFDPVTGAGDNGVDMTVMLAEAAKNGIGSHKILAFAEVSDSDPREVWAAGALFGGVLWGADLSRAQQGQTDLGLWDYAPESRAWGGHAILAAGRYADKAGTIADRTSLVSWAKVIDSTDTFMSHQVTERYVVILEEHLGSRQFRAGIDLRTLAADYEWLTKRKFPVPIPSPAPSPVPAPIPPSVPAVSAADQALAAAVPASWLGSPHIGGNATVQSALREWFQATGLTPGK